MNSEQFYYNIIKIYNIIIKIIGNNKMSEIAILPISISLSLLFKDQSTLYTKRRESIKYTETNK